MYDLIISGSRELVRFGIIEEAIEFSNIPISEIRCVLHGYARGIDRMGMNWAKKNLIPERRFIPDWDGKYGKGAGHARNAEMAEIGNACLAIWDGESPGTRNMIQTAIKKKLETIVFLPFDVIGPRWVPLDKALKDERNLPLFVPENSEQELPTIFEYLKGPLKSDLQDRVNCWMHGRLDRYYRTDIGKLARGHITDVPVQLCNVYYGEREGKETVEECYMVRCIYDEPVKHEELLIISKGDTESLNLDGSTKLRKYLSKNRTK